ncbi:SMP-30/gluconolactonase/LRE family protein [Rathayibacter toxicus]|uniref:SMP-30/gluconolactonase/LRE family protein n=1 Tax=Rathayibacter toxicus TaxID=145458 RepID=UPI001C03F96E|nr:SMP-30/gluconolactonase/LRE family protein [Rathayibacter toxicus]QWL33251.1 SMP-30/gluconolactonase/LRE family protein [Rathayibacter toxicus]QWL35346.1 SMP-30/gluconolactonase/LRE family protein [Rathayibacter toxicus]QWL37477.1 SMP-30/gluconolactonase/LRE family protein [Rathayibacter toxicus]QWL39570.1 SMP-30/gluconolactonase/LRE family protein [Rathayibacter toxicus]QWL41653.1 SMP-30/gluconolactonase/LRE family protein [Rathayibacter toxicus]
MKGEDAPPQILATLLAPGARLERLATGATWSEGPVWLPRERVVRWSDIPGDRILEWSAATGATRVHRSGVEFTNGRTLDMAGRVIQCSHGRRAIEREVDSIATVLVDRFGSARLNSPNDVIVASDGAIWFTDPPYGIVQPHEGYPGEKEYGGCFVFRFDETTGELREMATSVEEPNGLAFSPDERVLYVSDTSQVPREDASGNHCIHAFSVGANWELSPQGILAVITPGAPDGFRVDVQGRLWTSCADGVQILSSTGAVLARIRVPEVVGNVCFGGDDGTELFIAATTSLYRIRTRTRDAARRTLPLSAASA